MAVVLTSMARVKDWQALGRLNREVLVVQARQVGALRYRVYRNVHDASQLLVVAEFPDDESVNEHVRAIAEPLAGIVDGVGPDERLWEVLELDGIG